MVITIAVLFTAVSLYFIYRLVEMRAKRCYRAGIFYCVFLLMLISQVAIIWAMALMYLYNE